MAKAGAIRAGRAYVELFADDSRLVRGLKQAEEKLRKFGDAVANLGRQFLKLGAIIAAPVVLGTRVFAGFESQMARVKALTGATGEDFDRLNERALELGRSTVYTAAQAAEAMSFFALAGFDVNKILAATGPTLNLAAAGQLQMAESADIVAKIMAGMGVKAEDVGHAVDVLTKAMTTANTNLLQLGDAMKYVGPIAATAGIAFEEVTAAIQVLSNAGIQGELAGTSLRGILLTLTSPAKESAALMESLGISVSDAAGNVRPLVDIIKQFERVTAGLGSGAKLGVIGKIFDTRQAAAFARLIDVGSNELGKFTNALYSAGGTADRIAGVQLNTLTGTLLILTSALEDVGISIGKAIVGPLRAVATLAIKAVYVIGDWVRANEELVVAIAAAGAAFIVAGALLVGFGVALQALSVIAGILAVFLTTVGVALSLITSTLNLAIAAVVIIGFTIVANSKTAGRALQWLVERFVDLRSMATDVLNGIRDAITGGDILLATKILWGGIELAWTSGISFLESQWLGFKNTIISITEDIAAKFNNIMYGLGADFTVGLLVVLGRFDDFRNKLKSINELQQKLTAPSSDAAVEERRRRREAELDVIQRENEEEISKLRDELDRAIRQARRKAEGPVGPPLPEELRAAPNFDELADNVVSKTIDVVGTFNPAAILGLQAGGVQDRIANATAQTAKSVAAIQNDVRNFRGLGAFP